jgi:glycine cleavage system regulatory protein
MFEKFYRAMFFSVCSAIGVLAVTLAVLGPEIKFLYSIKSATIRSEQNNEKITQLLSDHQELINLINTDPNVLKRLAPVELGQEVNEPNSIAAQITADSLAYAKIVVEETEAQTTNEPQIPAWLLRATVTSSRTVLFAAGAGLILVSFVCFSTPEQRTGRNSDKA